MIFENYPKKRPELPAEYQKSIPGTIKRIVMAKHRQSALSRKTGGLDAQKGC